MHTFLSTNLKLSGKPFYSLSLISTFVDPVVSFLCLGDFYGISMEMLISFQHIQTSQSRCHIIIFTNHYELPVSLHAWIFFSFSNKAKQFVSASCSVDVRQNTNILMMEESYLFTFL